MKPPEAQARRFIAKLQSKGWQIRESAIFSEADYLHFPYPDGWYETLDDLLVIMKRRIERFSDPSQSTHLSPENRSLLIRVHEQAIDAISEANQNEEGA